MSNNTGVSTNEVDDVLPRFEDLGIETNYLKLGDKVFAVKQIGSGFDLDAEMREFYKVKVDALKALTDEAVVRDVNNDHQQQLTRIQAARSRGQIAIPSALVGKCVAYHQSAAEVMECIPVVYHPWQVIGTKSQIRDYFQMPNEGSIRAIAAEDEVSVLVSNNIYIPAFVGVGRRSQKLWMLGGLRTPHTMTSGDLCIGSSVFEQYARLDANEMSKQISVINLFSPANSSIRFGTPEQVISFENLFRTMCTVKSVERNVRTQWQTR